MWDKDEIALSRKVGIFELGIWPSCGAGPFQAWIILPSDGNSHVLPVIEGLSTIEGAKTAIEKRFRLLLNTTLEELGE